MGILSIVWGILAILGVIVAFFPCLGALNWFVIPFAVLGLIFAGVAVGNEQIRGQGVTGLILNGLAVVLGIIRLIMGGGIV